ncbi:hypothetical protein [Clostridium sp. KNHs214]|uniref:hypothetical protein n=1 Tax=Clostridium sp. KNHs214 TaxID=1540257 RepID=UPI00054FD8B9|nr:hypothetical protein [Clostridium sp. KNHs214]
MIKEYKVDKEKFQEIYDTQYKKHPKWKRTAWIRKGIIIMTIISPICIEIYGYRVMGRFKLFSDYFFIAIGVIWTLLMILVGYIRILRFKCDDIVNFKLNESLILKDEYFENGYKPNGEGISTTYDVMQVRYDEIERLVLNKYHNRLRLYANIKDTRYDDYEKGEKDYSVKEKARMAFYLYYENSEEFVRTLSEKSGVEIEIRDYSEE